MEASHPLVEVDSLSIQFGSRRRPVRAVRDVSFTIQAGETVALVGESGCGKSVTALSLARLLPSPPARYTQGAIRYKGHEVLEMKDSALRKLRGNEVSYVFQEPASSLNPVFTIGNQIGEAVHLHRPDANRDNEIVSLLQLVGIPDPETRMRAYPHQLSGGMQQRVMIAMALACRPRLLVADEPTTALDVTIQAQILDLLGRLQRELDMAVLLITHNLGLVADLAHRVNVMYAGRIVESGDASDVLRSPAHPYTRALLNAVPKLEGTRGRLRGIPGTVPNPAALPSGCAFHPRCPRQKERCAEEDPEREAVRSTHWVTCHYWDEEAKEGSVE
jgi:oligopeptide/dipeptide ABC transporter ATP-binding protein